MGANGRDGMGEAENAINIQTNNESRFVRASEEFGVQFYLQLDPTARPSIRKLRHKLEEASPKFITWKLGKNLGSVQIPGRSRKAVGVFFPVEQIKVTKEVPDAREYDNLVSKHLAALKDRLRKVSTIEKLKAEKIAHVQDIKVVAHGSFLRI